MIASYSFRMRTTLALVTDSAAISSQNSRAAASTIAHSSSGIEVSFNFVPLGLLRQGLLWQLRHQTKNQQAISIHCVFGTTIATEGLLAQRPVAMVSRRYSALTWLIATCVTVTGMVWFDPVSIFSADPDLQNDVETTPGCSWTWTSPL